MLAAIDDGAVCLIDTLSEAHYRGDYAMWDRPGHFPGAENAPSDALHDESGRYRGHDELVAMHNGDRDARTITYCGGGIAASLNPVDWHRLTGSPYLLRLVGTGLRKPKRVIPGCDVAGRVEAPGAEVTRVCSTANVEMVGSIDADHVVDYTLEDFTDGEARYDVIFDNMGNHPPSAIKRAWVPKGIYVLVGGPKTGRVLGPMKSLLRSVLGFMFSSRKAVPLNTHQTRDDLLVLQELLESGKVTSVIDRCYELSEVPDAFRYLEEGHARGKIIITP